VPTPRLVFDRPLYSTRYLGGDGPSGYPDSAQMNVAYQPASTGRMDDPRVGEATPGFRTPSGSDTGQSGGSGNQTRTRFHNAELQTTQNSSSDVRESRQPLSDTPESAGIDRYFSSSQHEASAPTGTHSLAGERQSVWLLAPHLPDASSSISSSRRRWLQQYQASYTALPARG